MNFGSVADPDSRPDFATWGTHYTASAKRIRNKLAKIAWMRQPTHVIPDEIGSAGFVRSSKQALHIGLLPSPAIDDPQVQPTFRVQGTRGPLPPFSRRVEE